jgi:hypothetical protein
MARRSSAGQWAGTGMNRNDAAHAEEDVPMSRSLVLSLLALACFATAARAAAPRDRDHDGLPDRWEKRYQLSTSKKSAKGNADHDGLRNLREYRLRTNPRRKDTDRDGYGDGAEVRAGTNPRKRKSHPSGRPTHARFPGAANTGVPPGTKLKPSGGLTINRAGAVIDRRDIAGRVVVNAPNVTIRRSRIRSNAMWVVDNNSTGLVVQDSEIINRPTSGEPNCHNGIGNSNFTVRRTEITGCENAMNIDDPGNVTFVDNYVHDLDTDGPSYVWGNTPHTDGIQGNGSNVTISRNWIDPTPGDDGNAVIFAPGGSNNYVIEDNYLDGRGTNYTIYAPRESGRSGNKINGNRMLRARYGYTACARVGVTVNEFNGNRDAGTGAAIAPDDGAGGSCSN